MNEEEKKAIEVGKEIAEKFKRLYLKAFNNEKITDKDRLSYLECALLSDFIEKLQKENEKLKQDRNNNYQMIALAQNEVLGYMQGYEDGKKLKRSAVACVVENQQYYIIKKEIEHYKEYIEKLQKENELAKKQVEYDKTHICTPQIIKLNYIPIQKIKDKIEELYQQDRNWSEEMSEPDSNFKNIDRNLKRIKNQIDVLQELIEESEENKNE